MLLSSICPFYLKKSIPPAEAGSLCLSSIATASTRVWRSPLISLLDTSGHIDKVPVFAQHGRTTFEQRTQELTKSVLPRPGFLVWNPATQLSKKPVGEQSLSSEPECLNPQPEDSTHVPKKPATLWTYLTPG